MLEGFKMERLRYHMMVKHMMGASYGQALKLSNDLADKFEEARFYQKVTGCKGFTISDAIEADNTHAMVYHALWSWKWKQDVHLLNRAAEAGNGYAQAKMYELCNTDQRHWLQASVAQDCPRGLYLMWRYGGHDRSYLLRAAALGEYDAMVEIVNRGGPKEVVLRAEISICMCKVDSKYYGLAGGILDRAYAWDHHEALYLFGKAITEKVFYTPQDYITYQPRALTIYHATVACVRLILCMERIGIYKDVRVMVASLVWKDAIKRK